MPEEYIPKEAVVDSDEEDSDADPEPFNPNLLTKVAAAFDVDVTYTLEEIPFL